MMEESVAFVKEHAVEVFICLGFVRVLYKALTFKNRPTIVDLADRCQTDAEKKALKRRNHVHRLRTALFYVPFVPIACLVLDGLVMKLFIVLMSYMMIEEYVCIIAPIPDAQRRKEVHLQSISKPSNLKLEQEYERDYTLTASDRILQLTAVLTVLGAWIGRFDVLVLTIIICSLIIFSFHVFQAILGRVPTNRDSLSHLALHFFGYLWLCVPLSHIIIPLDWPSGKGLSALLLWTSWIGDGAAYYIGSKFGRHKPFGDVSPNKSTEVILLDN